MPDLTGTTNSKPPRNYLPAYLLAAGALALAAYLRLTTPTILPSPAPLAVTAAPAIEPAPPGITPTPAPPATEAPHRASARQRQAVPEETSPPPPRFQLTRPTEIDGELVSAHARLEAHDLDGARQAYEQVIRRNPLDTGSLLALAAIASFQGQEDEAATLRQRAFTIDPGNPAAQAVLLDASNADSDPVRGESRLKALLARQAAPPLEFALGNLLARQRRWPEAQQAYFRAVAGDADNPDYLFNLAVSLEHLRQPRIAAGYYRQALAASAERAAAFDRRQAEQRAGTLVAAGQP